MIRRRSIRRWVWFHIQPGEARPLSAVQSFRRKIQEFDHGKHVDDLLFTLDGTEVHSPEYPTNDDNSWFYLDGKRHTLTIQHKHSRQGYVTIDIPAGSGNLEYTISVGTEIRLLSSTQHPPLPRVDIPSSSTTLAIAAELSTEFEAFGTVYKNLLSADVWAVSVECYEKSLYLRYHANQPDQSVSHLDQELFYDQFSSGFDSLRMEDAYILEDYLIDYLKHNLPNRESLEFFYRDEYWGIRPKANWYGSILTYNLRQHLADAWSRGGYLYQKIHRYEVWKGVIRFWYDGVYIWFEGYNKDPGIPMITLSYSQFAGSSQDFTKLYDEDIPEFAEFVTDYLEGQSLPVGFSKSGSASWRGSNPPYCYDVLDSDMIQERP